jgi:hypothetical protein
MVLQELHKYEKHTADASEAIPTRTTHGEIRAINKQEHANHARKFTIRTSTELILRTTIFHLI